LHLQPKAGLIDVSRQLFYQHAKGPRALQRGQNKAARALVAFGIALFVGLIASLAHHAHTDHGQSAVAVSRHSDPILIPGIQEPEEMRAQPIPVDMPTLPERLLGEAMQQIGDNSGRGLAAALLPIVDRILAKYPD
jgi:hypothetical protein